MRKKYNDEWNIIVINFIPFGEKSPVHSGRFVWPIRSVQTTWGHPDWDNNGVYPSYVQNNESNKWRSGPLDLMKKIFQNLWTFADDHLTVNQLSETDQLGVWSVTSCRIRSAGDVREWDDELRSLSKQASESGVGEGEWSEAHSGKSKGLLGEVEASSDCFSGTVTWVPATNGWSRSISAVHLFLGSRKKHFSRKSFPCSDNSDESPATLSRPKS